VAVLAMASAARAAGARFQHERAVIPGGRGPNRLNVDVSLLAGAQPLRYAPRPGAAPAFVGGLGDLRLYDPSGHEVGHLLIAPPAPAERWQNGTILPIQATEEESGFEVDLGSALRIDRLRLGGIPAPFLKRVRLEGSGDRNHWAVLVDSGTLFDLPDERLRRTEIGFAPGEFQYVRVTWDDRNSAPVPSPTSVAARVVTPSRAPVLVSVPVTFERRSSEPGRSRFRLRLPTAHLPVTAIELECGAGHLLRAARLSEPRLSGTTVVPVSLGSSTLRRAVRNDVAAADLRIPILQPDGPDLDLVVDDGSNPPLELLAVSAELAPLPWIFFESAAGETLTARFGNPTLAAPRYDLEAMRASVEGLPVADAHWGESRELGPPPTAEVPGGSGLPATGAPIDPSAFRYARALPAGPPGLTAVVLDAAVLAHSRGLADLRIADADAHQVPYVFETLDEPLAVDLDELQPVVGPTPRRPGESHYRLRLPYEHLPAARLVLTTSARVFERRIALLMEHPPVDARSRPRTETVVSTTWRHTDPDEAAPALVINLPALPVATAELVIDEGDNAPLLLGRPQLLLPAYRLRCFRGRGEELTLLYGDPSLGAPRYDLALLAPRVIGARAYEAAPAAEAPPANLPGKHGTAVQTQLFWGALIVAVVVLLFLIGRLLTKGAHNGAPG
jgi:hypothetical protein